MTVQRVWHKLAGKQSITDGRQRRMARRAAVVTAAAMLLAACAGSSDSDSGTSGAGGDPVSGGTLDLGITTDVTSLNPYDGAGDSTSLVLAQLNGQLFKSYDNKVEPALAEGIERSTDGKTVTITLRDGAKFSDGTPITPADVIFSIDQAKEGGAYGSLYKETITAEEASGDDRVVLTLARPTLNLEALLSYPRSAIIPADYGGLSKDEFYLKPVGAGPYVLDNRKPGTSLLLKKNPNFWQPGKPYLDALDFQVFNSVNAMTSAYQAKTIQAVPFAPREANPSFADANIVNTAPAATEMMFLNGRTGPLSDLKVRQAISAAIDRKSIVSQLGGPGDEPTTTYLPTAVLGDAEPAPVEGVDVEKAKQLLAETPYKDGATIKLIYPSGDTTLANTVQAIQEGLTKIGIKLDAQALDQGAWVDNVLSGQYEIAYQNISDPGSTAESSLAFFVASEGFGGGWPTDVATASLKEYQEATDAAGQAAALEKFQSWFTSELPTIPTVSLSPSLVLDPRVGGTKGLSQVTQQGMPLEELWLSK